MPVIIENLQNKISVTDEIIQLIEDIIHLSLEKENFNISSEVSVLLVDNEQIREINREQRNIDSATDVLSFPMVDMENGTIISDEGDFDLDEDLLLLGDIVISLEKAQEQAELYQHSFLREVAFLASHGIYHLLGYDHQTEEQEKIMIGKQEEVLKQKNLTR